VTKTPARYRVDLTEREAELVRRVLDQTVSTSELSNRTIGVLERVLRRIQFPNLPVKKEG